MAPYLLVGIDTEGDNQWDAAARAQQSFENIYALPKLHAIFGRHGVRPTYVVTWPVATDERSTQVLRFLKLRGDCEIGSHHHAWETPPCSPEDVKRHPYAKSLPLDQFEAQLAQLTAANAQAVGEPPVAYRSGRLVRRRARRRARAIRLSASSRASRPCSTRRTRAAPTSWTRRWRRISWRMTRPFVRDEPRAGNSVFGALDRDVPRGSRAHAPRAVAVHTRRILRSSASRVQWLRPSYSSFEEMCALARRLTIAGVPVLNTLFHSSEAIVGGSPYNRTDAELAAFLDRLDRFLAFAVGELGARPATFREFHDRYVEPAATAAAIGA